MSPSKSAARLSLADARDAAGRLLGRLQREPSALRLAVTGAMRRMEPTVASIDLLATAHEPKALLDAFTDPATCESVLGRGPGEAQIRLQDGTHVSLHVLPANDPSFFARVLDRTGTSAHTSALRAHAAAQDLRLEADGLYRKGERVDVSSEEELYAQLGLPWRPPELRQGGDLSAVPDDLVTMSDIKGLATVRLAEDSPFSLYDVVVRAAQEGYAWVMADAAPELVAEAESRLREETESVIRIFAAAALGRVAEIREGDPPPPNWHAEAQQRGEKALTTAVIERPSDIDRAIASVGAARRGAWRMKDVLNTLDADSFAAWLAGAR